MNIAFHYRYVDNYSCVSWSFEEKTFDAKVIGNHAVIIMNKKIGCLYVPMYLHVTFIYYKVSTNKY